MINPEEQKKIAEALELGATGDYPFGRLDDTDEGELKCALYIESGKLVLNFGKPVAWLALEAESVRSLAAALSKKADELDELPNSPHSD